MNGLVGAKNRGRGRPTLGKEGNKWIRRAKNRGQGAQPKEKNKNALVGAENRGWGRPLKKKRENKWISRG